MNIPYLAMLILALHVPVLGAAYSQELTATLNLRVEEGSTVGIIDLDETFEVVLKNETQSSISIPHPESVDGAGAVRFVITDLETKQSFDVSQTAPQTEGQQRPSFEIKPVSEFAFFVSFGEYRDGSICWQNLPAPNSGKQLSIRIEIDFESISVKSADYPMLFNFARAELPQHYLWSGFPDVALKMLKADPDLIERIDEDKRTPLHVAARFGHVEVVKWLLDNGANVDAVAYNKFTPLRLASDIEIVRMLLQAGANPNQVDAFANSPLQHAISNSKAVAADDQAAAHFAKWKRILNVYVEEGVEFQLLPAIEVGDLKQVKKLLEREPELLDRYVREQQPLRSAVQSGEVEIVRYLLSTFPDKMDIDNFAGGNGFPVSKLALSNQNSDVLQLLIDQGADLKRRITWQGPRMGRWVVGDNATLLHFAARDGVPEMVQLLLDRGVDPFAVARSDLANGDQQTALHVAAYFCKPENASVILGHKSFQSGDAQQRQKIVDECLSVSIRSQKTLSAKLCSAFIDAGANTKTVEGQPTLIEMISQSVHPSATDTRAIGEVVEVLAQAGVEIDFYSAVALQRVEQVEQLLQQDPQLAQARGTDGFPALHKATELGNVEIVRLLLAAGCDVNIKNESKDSGYLDERALHEAAFWNRLEIAELLVKSGAEVNAIAEKEITPLHRAARLGNIEIVNLLLENGADRTLSDHQGQTASDWTRNPNIKKMLKPAE